ncbi:MAG: HAD-IA family hydrolase [Chloroflexi bacterium]|nr:HAD-IA family hydrolase [Chloroflexota bacterium]
MMPSERPVGAGVANATAIKAVLLDLDGTVADTQELMFLCYSHALEAHSVQSADREVWEACTGLPVREIFARCLEPHATEHALVDELISTYLSHMQEIHDSVIRVYPGMTDALSPLQQNDIQLAIVTTKFRRQAERNLEYLNLFPYFDILVTGDECDRLKPHPEPFQRAMRGLGVMPCQSVGVGDSQHDIHAARAAGTVTAAACWGTVQCDTLLAAGPDLVLRQPQDLLQLLPKPSEWPLNPTGPCGRGSVGGP